MAARLSPRVGYRVGGAAPGRLSGNSKIVSIPSSSSHCSPTSTKSYCSTRLRDASLAGLMVARTTVTSGAAPACSSSLSNDARA
jgi:hypothetical protein